MIFVTGGAGFIGSNFVRYWLETTDEPVLNIDCLTYAGNLENLSDAIAAHGAGRYMFSQTDICDGAALAGLLRAHRPRAVLHFAAESHVDRSILGPDAFIRTNINGTFELLKATREYWQSLERPQRDPFRFLHVSTDEVYGSLGPNDAPFSETTAYAPNSPYAASKAASDHLVRAYQHTFGLPTLTTNCSNNYGPLQFPEKLIPLMISNALAGKPLPIYGDGQNVRDWLYVGDHCSAIKRVLETGKIGETYNVGGWNELKNIDVVNTLCCCLDHLAPRPEGSYSDLITFVSDRLGHDRRYAIDASKIERELGWRPSETFETGLLKTIQWYLDNEGWVNNVTSGAYREWIDVQYSRDMPPH